MQETLATLLAKYGFAGKILIGKSQVMLSTSIEFGVDHVIFVDGSWFDGKKLRGVFDITNSKCNFHRNETK